MTTLTVTVVKTAAPQGVVTATGKVVIQPGESAVVDVSASVEATLRASPGHFEVTSDFRKPDGDYLMHSTLGKPRRGRGRH